MKLRLPLYLFYPFIICILVLFQGISTKLYAEKYHVNYLTVSHGLSHNEVTSIVQDQHGFMWFGTRGGLNRYDGYLFKHYKPGSEVNRINSPSIECLKATEDGKLWIGTKSNGVSYYSSSMEAFSEFDTSPFNFSNRIVSLFEDSNDNIWIGSWDNGVICNCPKDNTSEQYLLGLRVSSIVQDANATIWCGTNQGLYYKKKGDKFQLYDALKRPYSINDIVIDDNDGTLWIAAWNRGLVKVDVSQKIMNEYPIYSDNNTLVRTPYSLGKDNNGNVWVGTWGEGIFVYDISAKQLDPLELFIDAPADKKIILDLYTDRTGNIWAATESGIIRFSTSNSFQSLSSSEPLSVMSVYVDTDNNKWVGDREKGLLRYTRNNISERIPFANPNLYHNNANRIVRFIAYDNDGLLWVGLGGGLFIYDEVHNPEGMIRASVYFNSPHLRSVLKVLDVEWVGDQVWVSTQQQGIFLFNKSTGQYVLEKHYTASNLPFCIRDNRVPFIIKDKYEQLWFGTYSGLFLFQEEGERFIPLEDIIKEAELPICDISLCATIDEKGDIWFGTPCGLAHLSFTKDKTISVDNYTVDDGLADDYITGIAFDGDLVWLSTSNGISSLDIQNKLVRNFNTSDGIQSSSFFEGSFYKSSYNTIHFGGHENLISFTPQMIIENTYQPPIVFTDLMVMSQPIALTKNWNKDLDINEVEEIVLTHKEKAISIEFASLDYKAPEQNLYTYKLDGFDANWQMITKRRNVTFSNLEPGKYTLKVKGSNSNGVWSDNVKELKIKILPAPWRTIYALIIYVVIILGLIYFIIRITNYQLKLENEVEVDRLKAEQQKLAHESRMVFFTNISHEIRTPLTLMMAPINELINKDFNDVSKSFFQNRVGLLNRSVNRLYDLVNQLLEIRKVEVGEATLKASETDLQELIADIVLTYKDFAKSKRISFHTRYTGNNWNCFVDKEKIRVILYNLLSNAFKYAGDPGEVSLKVNENENQFVIRVVNNGIGLSSSEIEHLFDRFYQGSNQSGIGSSGIGLSLVKSFVELHSGTINVRCIPGVDTIFRITLLKGQDHLSAEQIVDNVDSQTKNLLSLEPFPLVGTINNSEKKDKTILVVDDNIEVREYLKSLLCSQFNVSIAEDGIAAIKIVSHYQIDLIISDVMMPRMDGLEFCERIKTDEKTSDVPVILLTAKSTMQDQKEGLSKGADAYVVKPFDTDFLLGRIHHLLSTRDALIDKYSKKMKLEPTQMEITSEEALFIEKTIKHVESQISNPSFNHVELASHMAMSASTFYRRIKKLTGMTPADFVKSIRLKRAAQYLRDSQLSISEITENVGYSDLKNFRKIFKNEFGDTPTNYRQLN